LREGNFRDAGFGGVRQTLDVQTEQVTRETCAQAKNQNIRGLKACSDILTSEEINKSRVCK